MSNFKIIGSVGCIVDMFVQFFEDRYVKNSTRIVLVNFRIYLTLSMSVGGLAQSRSGITLPK